MAAMPESLLMPPRQSHLLPARSWLLSRRNRFFISPAVDFDPGDHRHPVAQPFAQVSSSSSTILTGMRRTILVKLPVALSGGNSANCEPVAGEISSTYPLIFTPGKASTV